MFHPSGVTKLAKSASLHYHVCLLQNITPAFDINLEIHIANLICFILHSNSLAAI